MPTYEYKCDACGHRFERFQSINAEPVRICEVCGKEAVTRVVSGGSGLIFKGSGFYITDYKNKHRKTNITKPKTKATEKKE